MDPAILQHLFPARKGEPLPFRSLCFSTCTAGKWVCSTSVCPGTPDPALGSAPFLSSHSFGAGKCREPGLLLGLGWRTGGLLLSFCV